MRSVYTTSSTTKQQTTLKRAIRSRSKGQGAVELCGALLVLIPVVLAGIDLGFIALGSTINDEVCHEAARAAASGPSENSSPSGAHQVQLNSSPYQRALAIIKKHAPTNFPIKVIERPEVTETIRDVPPAKMGGAIDGDIAVKTSVLVSPPFILQTYCPQGVTLTSRHVVPFTYVVAPANEAEEK